METRPIAFPVTPAKSALGFCLLTSCCLGSKARPKAKPPRPWIMGHRGPERALTLEGQILFVFFLFYRFLFLFLRFRFFCLHHPGLLGPGGCVGFGWLCGLGCLRLSRPQDQGREYQG